jgi:hypothetical protein
VPIIRDYGQATRVLCNLPSEDRQRGTMASRTLMSIEVRGSRQPRSFKSKLSYITTMSGISGYHTTLVSVCVLFLDIHYEEFLGSCRAAALQPRFSG